MAHTITLLPGDGIGAEIAEAMIRVVEAAGVDVLWDRQVAGTQALEQTGDVIPPALLDSLRRNRVGIKGPITTPIGKGFTSANVTLRKTLDLYVGLRPTKVIPELRPQYAGWTSSWCGRTRRDSTRGWSTRSCRGWWSRSR